MHTFQFNFSIAMPATVRTYIPTTVFVVRHRSDTGWCESVSLSSVRDIRYERSETRNDEKRNAETHYEPSTVVVDIDSVVVLKSICGYWSVLFLFCEGSVQQQTII